MVMSPTPSPTHTTTRITSPIRFFIAFSKMQSLRDFGKRRIPKSEARRPKFETNPKLELPIKYLRLYYNPPFITVFVFLQSLELDNLSFEFASNFELRISNFLSPSVNSPS